MFYIFLKQNKHLEGKGRRLFYILGKQQAHYPTLPRHTHPNEHLFHLTTFLFGQQFIPRITKLQPESYYQFKINPREKVLKLVFIFCHD